MDSTQDKFRSSKPQLNTLNAIVKDISENSSVAAIINRGSFASENQDRASDLDLLFVIDNDRYYEFLEDLTSELTKSVDLVFEQGWIDTIVPDFGGIGFVYLGRRDGKLIQIDIYVTSLHTSQKIFNLQEKKILYSRDTFEKQEVSKEAKFQVEEDNDRFIKNQIDDEFQVFFECILVIFIYSKQIYRSHTTLALKYRYMTLESLARLLRLIHTPDTIDYLMYSWERDFKNIEDPLVNYFVRNIQQIDIYSESEILNLVRFCRRIVIEHLRNEQYLNTVNELEGYILKLLAINEVSVKQSII